MNDLNRVTMKIAVTLVVEVCPHEWAMAYDCDENDKKYIRNDVKGYIAGSVLGASDAPINVVDYR